MKNILSYIVIFTLVLSLTGCVSNEITTAPTTDTIDYSNAMLFERALEEGVKVKGKVVQFYVEKYAPDSVLGINCHAGEHLNFLFDNNLNVETGDTIVVRVTKEPTQMILLESWKIPCEFIKISEKRESDSTTKEIDGAEENTTKKTTTKAAAEWEKNFSNELAKEIEKAFTQIGENPKNIIKVTYLGTRSTGYIFEQKDYKVEFAWSFGKPRYKHSRYYRITTQNYFDGEPEKADYPDEFLATIKFWVGDDGYGTNINQWSWTGNGEKQ